MDKSPELEIWADSFKEGEWFLENIATYYYNDFYRVSYRYNFQPVFDFFNDNNSRIFSATVYGNYRSWTPLPTVISNLLEFGKPDIVVFDRIHNKILFAVEETAAVPTGNQSLQRLERVCYSAEMRIPFIYLVSEYGKHLDGGIRRTSIWPSYLALKLSSQYQTPSLTLLYSDRSHPEDYNFGKGVTQLAEISNMYFDHWLGKDISQRKIDIFTEIFISMGTFILDQYQDISPHLPGRTLLTNNIFINFLIGRSSI